MLYNQAQLARIYSRAWRITGQPEYHRIATETLDYVINEMQAPGGGFYSATDADSEGEEGKFFAWQLSELQEALSPPDFLLVTTMFGASEQGNFEGANVLYLPKPLIEIARQQNITYQNLGNSLSKIRQQLYKTRQNRVPPLRDNKVITEWNGMMITALAEAAMIQNSPPYLKAAQQAANFIWQQCRDSDGLLLRTHLKNEASTTATLEDYAFYLESLLTLYDATDNNQWLQLAETVYQQMLDLFHDKEKGGFFISQKKVNGPLILRNKSAADNATASGNSVALVAMVKLFQRTGKADIQDMIQQQIAYFSSSIKRSPIAFATMLTGISNHLEPAPLPLQFGASGKLRAKSTLTKTAGHDYQLSVRLALKDGWHINSHQPNQKNLIATELLPDANNTAWETTAVQYPAGEDIKVGFSKQPLSLYQGNLKLTATMSSTGTDAPLVARLSYQACNDKRCLLPEELVFVLYPRANQE